MTIRLLTIIAVAGWTGQALAADEQALAEAKLIIEHNATDLDTGFQGFIDGEGWQRLAISGPKGEVFAFEAAEALTGMGLTELFFETVEPLNEDVPLDQLLPRLHEGRYGFAGTTLEGGTIVGEAVLSHAIPAGPVLTAPLEDAQVPAAALVVSWEPVTETISGAPIDITAYHLVVEKAVDPHPRMIGKFGLSVYLPATVTEITLPLGFLEPATKYEWEVLAIAENGNQTLSASSFSTQ
jgi:hypothetical protein